ncbi:MAG: hypothetical protein Q3962_06440 [Corynebacterium sp.]|nr:hypothetical protein [Corynebacterium sp.]
MDYRKIGSTLAAFIVAASLNPVTAGADEATYRSCISSKETYAKAYAELGPQWKEMYSKVEAYRLSRIKMGVPTIPYVIHPAPEEVFQHVIKVDQEAGPNLAADDSVKNLALKSMQALVTEAVATAKNRDSLASIGMDASTKATYAGFAKNYGIGYAAFIQLFLPIMQTNSTKRLNYALWTDLDKNVANILDKDTVQSVVSYGKRAMEIIMAIPAQCAESAKTDPAIIDAYQQYADAKKAFKGYIDLKTTGASTVTISDPTPYAKDTPDPITVVTPEPHSEHPLGVMDILLFPFKLPIMLVQWILGLFK